MPVNFNQPIPDYCHQHRGAGRTGPDRTAAHRNQCAPSHIHKRAYMCGCRYVVDDLPAQHTNKKNAVHTAHTRPTYREHRHAECDARASGSIRRAPPDACAFGTALIAHCTHTAIRDCVFLCLVRSLRVIHVIRSLFLSTVCMQIIYSSSTFSTGWLRKYPHVQSRHSIWGAPRTERIMHLFSCQIRVCVTTTLLKCIRSGNDGRRAWGEGKNQHKDVAS